jgi:NAD(P)-dependent dehydrogenase (short-subunit alcohol dehydrogenase family)
MDLQLAGKVALVTGSSNGIGAEIARTLAREGATVIVHGRSSVSVEQVALNWLRHQAGVVISVIGSRRVTQLQENLDCLKYPLTPEQVQRLDAASRIALGFPHDFLASDEVRELVYGGESS